MKILFVTYSRSMFGASLALVQLIVELRERYGVKPYVLMWDVEDGSLHEELERLKIPYLIHPMKAWVISSDAKLKRLRGYKAYIKNQQYMRQILKRLEGEHFDLVYSNNSTVQIGADLAVKMHLPHIWHVREYGKRHYNIEFSYSKRAVKKRFANANAVIAISKDLEQYIREEICDTANIVCIYDGVNNKKTKRLVWNRDKRLEFCYVGVLSEGKNQLELLKAVNVLIESGYKDFHVTLIGEGQEYETILREYCKEMDLKDYVSFTGYCNNVMEILDSMDVGIICSKSEAFGRVTVEYMFSSMPVIGAIGAGTSELIIHEENGYLYPSGDYHKLAEYMQKFIEDRDLLKNMGLNAFSHAGANYNSERNTEQIYHLIQSVVGKEE